MLRTKVLTILPTVQRLWRRCAKWFTPIAIVGTLLGVGIALWRQREAIINFDWQANPRALLIAALAMAVAPLVQGVGFWVLLRLTGGRPQLLDATMIWSRSFAVRYAPSGALAILLRVRGGERLRSTREQIITATAYEQLIALNSGLFAAMAGFLIAKSGPPTLLLLLVAAAASITFVLRPSILGGLAQRIAGRAGLQISRILRGRELVGTTLFNMLGWVSTGIAVSFMLEAFTGKTPSIAYLVGAYGLAWALGFIAPLLPGGLGLREATLVTFLAPMYGVGSALILAIALRLVSTAGEFIALGITEAAHLVARKKRAEWVADVTT